MTPTPTPQTQPPETSSRTDTRPSRTERSRLTHELLASAHETDDSQEKSRLLDEVVLLNMGVAEAVAGRYRNRGVAQADLEQAAFEGLIKAVHKFDPTVRPDLLTYAVPTIRGEVQRYFRDQSWMVRPPRRIQEMQWKISRTVERLSQDLGRPPTDAEITDDLGCSEGEVREAVQGFGCFQVSSLDRPLGEAEGVTLGDALADDSVDAQSAAEARAMLVPALRHLSARDRRILFMRFFEDRSQQEIGEVLGVTQMQVSRLLTRILRDVAQRVGDAAA